MKKVIAGCIDLILEFDSASELDRYIADIEAKKQEYSIVDRKELPGDRIMIRIHRQYNKSPWFSGGIATDLPPLQTYNTRTHKALKSELLKNT